MRDLERLARLETGGSPERPLEVESSAQVDVVAASRRCPLCEGGLRLDQHTATTVNGVRLRVARVTCTQCGVGRETFFRLAAGLPS